MGWSLISSQLPQLLHRQTLIDLWCLPDLSSHLRCPPVILNFKITIHFHHLSELVLPKIDFTQFIALLLHRHGSENISVLRWLQL